MNYAIDTEQIDIYGLALSQGGDPGFQLYKDGGRGAGDQG